MTEISRALLEADVNIRLVKQLKDNVKVYKPMEHPPQGVNPCVTGCDRL